ncbi:MAG TPA: hypothetical protein VFB62_18210 [Polyangiaceae bacterium]|jgi:hypothetical protein|nr:hypothetical protein [Polyangiaceae bacterium]
MNRVGLVLGMLALGCAKGSEAELYELPSGVYELLTVEVDAQCALEDVITAGREHVGKVARVEADSSERRVIFQACDAFFEDDCIPDFFSEEVTLLRDEHDLFAEDATWEVPTCSCFEPWRGTRKATGRLVDNGRAELTWTFELQAAPEGCACTAEACSGTVVQELGLN